jgi:streptogramin lyase
MVNRRTAVAASVIVLLCVAAVGAYFASGQGQGKECSAPEVAPGGSYQAGVVQFGSLTEYCLANPSRFSNALAVAPDGSVWFGEEAVPGFGHLLTNGTVFEYPWGYSNGQAGEYQTGIWGVTVWNGRVWGTDLDHGALVGLDPQDGKQVVVNTSATVPTPYTLSASPDGSLWFTSLASPPRIGRMSANLSVSVYTLPALGKEAPLQVRFVNSTSGYLVALNPFSSTGAGGLYSFSVNSSSRTLDCTPLAGLSLFDPDSLALLDGGVFIAQHGPSSVVGYDLSAGTWTVYPTSTVSYLPNTLPYFVEADGSKLWFNEHYGNRIALLDPVKGTLTEYSEADPPIADADHLQNDLTIAVSSAGLWFTSATGNYVGLVDGSRQPAFSVSVEGSNALALAMGGTQEVKVQVTGSWSGSLQVKVSDSENYTSVPRLISIQPGEPEVPSGSGPATLGVALAAESGLQPGRYTVGVTLSDGLVSQTAYLFVTVG